MKPRLLAGVALTCSIFVSSLALGAEQYLQFIDGLREREYYDYAILYLDQIGAKPSTPAEIKEAIPFHKAMVLKDSTKVIRSPEKQIEALNQAEGFLADFVKASPNHAYAAEANSERASILLSKAQAENLQAKSPSNQGGKRDFQKRARDYVAKAREVFQQAFDQHEANFKKFPVFINEQSDPAQHAARAAVEKNLITTSLSLGMCTYEEAHTHDAGSAEFKQLLNKAAEEFEKMHQKYRSQVGGLHARAWQGKCYEEQNDLQKAMGIYNELLDHPGENAALSLLKTQVLYFKLICLNSKDRNDQQLVVDLAEDWIKKHPNESRTRLGLSIQWEQAKAFETLGDNPNLIKMEAERFWKQARNSATQIQRFPGEFRDVASAMLQRVQIKLGGKVKNPDTFALAYGQAHQAFNAAIAIKKEIDDGIKTKRPPEEIAQLNADRNNELTDAAVNYELALALAKPTDEANEVANARLHYAYVNFWQRKNYEAAVLAGFVARTANKDDSTVALDAAYMAMAAYVQAYNDFKAPIDEKAGDMRLIVKAANLIADRWPSSDKANEAYMILGRMIGAQKKPAEAAGWFTKVPESDPKYPEAQLAAGQAYWTAYIGAARSLEKPSTEQLASWQKSAEAHLRSGIDKMSKTAPKDSAPPELIGAKLSLSTILVSQGKEAEALKILQDDPQSVVKAVTVADEQTRPAAGVTSRRFATETYKLVLRCYIGSGNLEKARETMKTLESIAAAGGADGGAEITELYVGLGKLLKDELERLRDNGETERFSKLMTSFETFLNDMAQRKDQGFGSLSWIGETYFALGETSSSDAAKANGFYDKAGTAFSEILNRVKADSAFASAAQVYGVKLRLVYVHRLKKEFEAAETLMNEVVRETPNALKVQVQAAELYQDWGTSGQADALKKLIVAVNGTLKVQGLTWGWMEISKKLQRSPDFATNTGFQEAFLNARHNATICRRTYALQQPVKDKQKLLEICKADIRATILISKDISDEDFAKFNSLYKEIQADLGEPATDLTKSPDIPVTAPETAKTETPEDPKDKGAATPTTDPDDTKPKGPPGMDSTTWAMFIGTMALGLVAVGWIMMKSRSKPKPKAYGTAPAGPVSFTGFDPGAAAPAAKPKPRPAAAPGAAAPGAAAPAARPAAGTTGAAKPAGTTSAPKPAAPAAPGTAAAPKPKPKPKPPAPPAG